MVRSGEYGDRFYIVRTGCFAIERDRGPGSQRTGRRLLWRGGPSHDVRRTATVRAETLYAICAGPRAFVAAITGHPAARPRRTG